MWWWRWRKWWWWWYRKYCNKWQLGNDTWNSWWHIVSVVVLVHWFLNLAVWGRCERKFYKPVNVTYIFSTVLFKLEFVPLPTPVQNSNISLIPSCSLLFIFIIHLWLTYMFYVCALCLCSPFVSHSICHAFSLFSSPFFVSLKLVFPLFWTNFGCVFWYSWTYTLIIFVYYSSTFTIIFSYMK